MSIVVTDPADRVEISLHDLPVLDAAELQPADVACIVGALPFAQGIRAIDGSRTDHVVVVAWPRVGDEPAVFAEQNFKGFRFAPFHAYDEPVERIVVRRSRNAPVRGDVVGLLDEYGRREPAYAWHRLVDIILSSLPRLEILNSEDRERRAQFAERMGWMFALGASTVTRDDCGVCVDPAMFLGHRLDGGAHAIALPDRPVGDYLRWREAAERFERLLHDAAADGGKDTLGPLGRILEHTVGRRPGRSGLVDDLERHLLASHLEGRAVVTPYDIANTPTFVDVGVLDLAAMTPPAARCADRGRARRRGPSEAPRKRLTVR